MVPGAAIVAGMPAVAEAAVAAEIFFEANEAAGVDAPHRSSWAEFVHDSFTSGYLGIGQAWGDYDNGRLGRPVPGRRPEPEHAVPQRRRRHLQHPRAVRPAWPLADAWTGGAVWADYDNDGWRDLYVLTHGPNVLFRNEAGAGFRDVTATAGVGDTGKGSTAAWGDYDGDGFLDLFVANWRCYPDCPRDNAAALASDRLYRNRGAGTFEDVSRLHGDKLRGAAFSASFADFDDDGAPDILRGQRHGRAPGRQRAVAQPRAGVRRVVLERRLRRDAHRRRAQRHGPRGGRLRQRPGPGLLLLRHGRTDVAAAERRRALPQCDRGGRRGGRRGPTSSAGERCSSTGKPSDDLHPKNLEIDSQYHQLRQGGVMSRKYIIIIESGGQNCSAYAPDLPGCIATGKTIAETKRNMTEAIKAHLQFMA